MMISLFVHRDRYHILVNNFVIEQKFHWESEKNSGNFDMDGGIGIHE